ncbi:MAG: hypothetical protein ACXWM7_04135 [Parachlamydiaceae bacterium]
MKAPKKPTQAPKSSLFKKISVLLCLAAIAASAFWLWDNYSDMRLSVYEYIDNGEITTFEVHYTPEKLLELYGEELLNKGERLFQKGELLFYPYVLFHVKFSSHQKTPREGVLLWSLVDGEMVIDSKLWQTSHGFEDAINAQATNNDFKILNALEKATKPLTVEQLEKELHVDKDLLLVWIEKAKSRHLVIQKDQEIQPHFQNPHLPLVPQTRISQSLVSKPYNFAQKVSWNYSPNQLKKIAKSAFGNDFAIRSEEIVYLPVYRLDILNPDGSVRAVNFNAVVGKPIQPHYLH